MCDCIGFSTSHRDHWVESERRSEEQSRRRKAYRGLHQYALPLHQGHGDARQCAGPWAGPGTGAGTANSETGPGLGYTHAHGNPQDESAVHGKNAVGTPPQCTTRRAFLQPTAGAAPKGTAWNSLVCSARWWLSYSRRRAPKTGSR